MDIVGFMRRYGIESKTALAKMLDTKPQNINKWFNKSQKEPTLSMCKKLLSIGMSVEEIFGLEIAEKVVVFKNQQPIQPIINADDPAVQKAMNQAISDMLLKAAKSISDQQ